MLRKTLLALLIFLSGCAAQQKVVQPAGVLEPSDAYESMRRVAARFTCEKETFLEHAQLDAADCSVALEAYAPVCWEAVEPVYPSDDFVGSPEERDAIAVHRGQLVIYCAQANILMDKAIPKMIEEELSDSE